jgi:hypothetical protein
VYGDQEGKVWLYDTATIVGFYEKARADQLGEELR